MVPLVTDTVLEADQPGGVNNPILLSPSPERPPNCPPHPLADDPEECGQPSHRHQVRCRAVPKGKSAKRVRKHVVEDRKGLTRDPSDEDRAV